MPDYVREALECSGLTSAYLARADYQQNDYMRWITDAKRETTRRKRVNQMLEELAQGSVYMRISWHAR